MLFFYPNARTRNAMIARLIPIYAVCDNISLRTK